MESLILAIATKPTGEPLPPINAVGEASPGEVPRPEGDDEREPDRRHNEDPNSPSSSPHSDDMERPLVAAEPEGSVNGSTRIAAARKRLFRRDFNTLLNPLPRRQASSLDRRALKVHHHDDHAALVAPHHRNELTYSSAANHSVDRASDLSVSRPRTAQSDRSQLLQERGPFEARKALALARMSACNSTITSRELRVLRFIAAVDHGPSRPPVECAVETKNFRLQWLLSPAAPLQSFERSSSSLRSKTVTADCSRSSRSSHADIAGISAVLPESGGEPEDSVAGVDHASTRSSTSQQRGGEEGRARSPSQRRQTRMGGRPKKLLNLFTMPTNIALKRRTDNMTEDRTPMLNSPRSVLTCLRNGVQPSELQEIPLDAMVLTWSSRGWSREMIVQRHRFQEELRQKQLEALQQEYASLCQRVTLDDICTFFEFVALNDGLQAPELVPVRQRVPAHSVVPSTVEDGGKDDESARAENDGAALTFADDSETLRYEVRVSGDATIFEAIRKIEDKAQHDRAMLNGILQAEISNTRKKAEAFAEEQRRNAAKEMAHRKEVQHREELRQREALLRKMEAAEKAAKRSKLMEAAAQKRLDEIASREQRAAEAEKKAEAAMEERVEQRRTRQERKLIDQAARLQQAEKKLETIEVERRERFAEKQRLRDALLRQKEFFRLQKAEDDQIANEILKARREAIAERAEEVLQERIRRAQENGERVEKRLKHFAAEKQAEFQFKKLIDMRRELNREEVFEANERRAQEVVDRIVERRVAHDASFQQFQEQQQRQKQEIRERELQVLLLKDMDKQRYEQKRAYDLLLSAEECTRKLAKSSQLEETREEQKVALQAERQVLQHHRQQALQESHEEMVHQERENYFQLYRSSDPGDAVILRGTNARSVAIMKKTLGKPLKPTEEEMLQLQGGNSAATRSASAPGGQLLLPSLYPSRGSLPAQMPRPSTSLDAPGTH